MASGPGASSPSRAGRLSAPSLASASEETCCGWDVLVGQAHRNVMNLTAHGRTVVVASTPRLRGLVASLLAVALVFLPGCQRSLSSIILVLKNPSADTETVRENVVALGDYLAEKEVSGRPFDEGERLAVELLKDVVANKNQALVNRMSALSALRRLRSVDLIDLYVETLDDDHWGVRWEAAKCLVAHPDPRASRKLGERLRKEQQPEVVLDIVKALAAIGDRTSLRSLLEAFLFDPTGRYRGHRLKIHGTLKRLSGRDHAITEDEKWRQYYEEEFPAEEAPDGEPKEGGTETSPPKVEEGTKGAEERTIPEPAVKGGGP